MASDLAGSCHVEDAEGSRSRVGVDGNNAYIPWTGRGFYNDIEELGENVLYLNLVSTGNDECNAKWGYGIYLGVGNEALKHRNI